MVAIFVIVEHDFSLTDLSKSNSVGGMITLHLEPRLIISKMYNFSKKPPKRWFFVKIINTIYSAQNT